ncbi:hypothetical protein J5N97_011600 [Dioscorea zingiberensis]|uniref:Gnk2-homologous domain-containing protein n=1 Tax=Dioscorea zingiberensis TaxID=325984 RepID=A0A9D5D0N5_9LILI|nr:hypothetical protein J5N97_011600 [Dioscorea zingiberensis]
MSMVALMLNSYFVSLQAPSKPAFCVGLTGGMDSDAFPKGYNFSTGEFDSLSDPLYRSCGSTKYTANSTYESNLLALLPSLVYYGSDQGFYKDTVGRVPDQIYALSLCRGDTNTSACWSCLDLARQNALQLCAYNKATIIYYDNCLLRYSNQNFLNSTDNSDVILMLNIEDVTDPDNFIKLPSELVNRTFHYAAFKSSQRFGTGEANFTDAEPKLYGLAQCSRDFSGDQCYNCLTGMLPVLQNIAGKRGGRVIGSRCYFRPMAPTQQGMVIPHRRYYPQWDQEMETRITSAWEHWTRGTISEILDPSLGDQLPRSEALRCIHMGLLCVQEDPASRPSMSMVVLMLNSYSVSLQAPSKPAFFYGLSGGMDSDTFRKGYNFSTGEFNRSSDKSIPMTPNEVSISEMEPR